MNQLINDASRVDLISTVIVEHVSSLLGKEGSSLQDMIEASEGYNNLTFSEYHLATVKAFAELQVQALEKFMLLERD